MRFFIFFHLVAFVQFLSMTTEIPHWPLALELLRDFSSVSPNVFPQLVLWIGEILLLLASVDGTSCGLFLLLVTVIPVRQLAGRRVLKIPLGINISRRLRCVELLWGTGGSLVGSRLWGTARSLVGSRWLCGMSEPSSQAPSDGSKVKRSILSCYPW